MKTDSNEDPWNQAGPTWRISTVWNVHVVEVEDLMVICRDRIRAQVGDIRTWVLQGKKIIGLEGTGVTGKPVFWTDEYFQKWRKT